ncbi:MAG: histidinol-phosphate transaminase [Desulfobacterales bacterium]
MKNDKSTLPLDVSDSIRSIKPYVPGKPLEELEREYGIADSIKLASNENPLGPSPKAVEAVMGALSRLNRYPEGSARELIRKLAGKHGIDPGNIIVGNGSDDIIGMLAVTFLGPGTEVILPRPSFLMYEIAARSVDAVPVFASLDAEMGIDLEKIVSCITSATRMIFLCNPNNPTGTVITDTRMEAFFREIPTRIIIVVDEAYIEFVRDKACTSTICRLDESRPVVALRTFSKAYGLAGLRAGYGVMPREIAGFLNRVRQPFNMNALAQAGAAAALEDAAFFEKTLKTIHDGLDDLYRNLERLGLRYFPTQANFFLIDVGRNADEVFERLLRKGVIVRSMTAYGFPTCIRVNVGLPQENKRLIQTLENVLA